MNGTPVTSQQQPSTPGRRILAICVGVVFVTSLLILLPWASMALNAACSWPRLQFIPTQVLGIVLFAPSIGVMFYCARVLVHVGQGTPAPLDPPKRFVACGLYCVSRNPMYLAYLGILVSYFLYSGELALLLYAGAIAVVIGVWVRYVEEPGLQQRFGEEYLSYTQRVPRWFGLKSIVSGRAT